MMMVWHLWVMPLKANWILLVMIGHIWQNLSLTVMVQVSICIMSFLAMMAQNIVHTVNV